MPKLSTHTAFFFFFYCFITRLTYQHTQSHMLTHILCIHRGMYLIHMHFILLRQIHLIPLLRTDSEYQQLPSNNLKGCSSERQRAGKSELRVQPHVTDSRYCLGTANGAVWYHEKPTSLPRKQPPGTHFLLRKPDAINTQLKCRKQMVWLSCKTGYSVSRCQENYTALTYLRSPYNPGL